MVFRPYIMKVIAFLLFREHKCYSEYTIAIKKEMFQLKNDC